jgi:hypothetical protein
MARSEAAAWPTAFKIFSCLTKTRERFGCAPCSGCRGSGSRPQRNSARWVLVKVRGGHGVQPPTIQIGLQSDDGGKSLFAEVSLWLPRHVLR